MPGEALEHQLGVALALGLAEDRAVEHDRGVDPEDRAIAGQPGHGSGLPLRVRADELDRIGARRVVLLIAGRGDLERDPELRQDRAALRRRRGEERAAARAAQTRQARFRAFQISSIGHFVAHSSFAHG